MENYLRDAFIPLMATVALLYFGLKMMILEDPTVIFGTKQKKVLKDEKKFAKEGGKLLLLLAGASLLMAVVLYWQPEAALICLLAGIVIFGILWYRMNKKYGE